MTDDRRRRDEERLRHAQEIANALREHHAELAAALRGNTHRARTEPVVLAERRRAHADFATKPFDDDVG
jgi:hypothetical protein